MLSPVCERKNWQWLCLNLQERSINRNCRWGFFSAYASLVFVFREEPECFDFLSGVYVCVCVCVYVCVDPVSCYIQEECVGGCVYECVSSYICGPRLSVAGKLAAQQMCHLKHTSGRSTHTFACLSLLFFKWHPLYSQYTQWIHIHNTVVLCLQPTFLAFQKSEVDMNNIRFLCNLQCNLFPSQSVTNCRVFFAEKP